jgi:hypothetical protein
MRIAQTAILVQSLTQELQRDEPTTEAEEVIGALCDAGLISEEAGELKFYINA